MNSDAAQALALDALIWLCNDENLLPVFLAATGAAPADLRAALGDAEPGLALAALDFILMRDATVLDCATSLGIAPERLAQAHVVLQGAAGQHWT